MRQFLFALIGLVVTYPFITDLNNGDQIENLLMMVLLISAVLAVGSRIRVLAILLLIPAILTPWLNEYWPRAVPQWLVAATHMIFVGFVIVQLLLFIVRETRVNAETLCAGISAYLMLAIFFTPAYLMASHLGVRAFDVAHVAPSQELSRFDALYFSFVSLTCVGCNDITALSKIARTLVITESTSGVLCLALLIARLVALYSHQELGGPRSGAS